MSDMCLFGIEPLSGAYGRDYTSIKKAQADFDAGKDFKMPGGTVTDKQTLVTLGVVMVDIRYNKNRDKDCLRVQTETQAKKVLARK